MTLIKMRFVFFITDDWKEKSYCSFVCLSFYSCIFFLLKTLMIRVSVKSKYIARKDLSLSRNPRTNMAVSTIYVLHRKI